MTEGALIIYWNHLRDSNAVRRLVIGIVMLHAFIFLCKNNKLYIIAFTVCLTSGICFELISVVRSSKKPFAVHGMLVSYLAVTIYLSKIVPEISSLYPQLKACSLLVSFNNIGFYLHAIGLMAVILCLKQRSLRSQLLLISAVHLSCYVLGMACAFSIKNLAKGKFYYFFPAILVIANDSWAYAIGKIFGRTRLYALSPKKTVEGFLGAAFCTLLTSLGLVYAKLNCGFLPDSADDLLSFPLSTSIRVLRFPVAYFHALSFAFFASFFAPFLGFLGSAIKRTFKKKDFGDVIPGHGGLTDRMDCQLLMVFFTHYYLNAFVNFRDDSLLSLSRYIIDNYSKEEVSLIVAKLTSFLGQR